MGKHWAIKSISFSATNGGYDVEFENLVSKIVVHAFIPELGLFESDQTKKWQPDLTNPKKDPVLKAIKKGIDKATP